MSRAASGTCDSHLHAAVILSGNRRYAELAEVRRAIEDGTPVVLVHPELPVAFLLGAPDEAVLNSIFARLTILVVRVGAKSVIIDGSGLVDPSSPPVMVALEKLLSHRKIRGKVATFVVGLDPEPERRWLDLARETGVSMQLEENFDRAVDMGLAAAGYRLVKT